MPKDDASGLIHPTQSWRQDQGPLSEHSFTFMSLGSLWLHLSVVLALSAGQAMPAVFGLPLWLPGLGEVPPALPSLAGQDGYLRRGWAEGVELGLLPTPPDTRLKTQMRGGEER